MKKKRLIIGLSAAVVTIGIAGISVSALSNNQESRGIRHTNVEGITKIKGTEIVETSNLNTLQPPQPQPPVEPTPPADSTPPPTPPVEKSSEDTPDAPAAPAEEKKEDKPAPVEAKPFNPVTDTNPIVYGMNNPRITN